MDAAFRCAKRWHGEYCTGWKADWARVRELAAVWGLVQGVGRVVLGVGGSQGVGREVAGPGSEQEAGERAILAPLPGTARGTAEGQLCDGGRWEGTCSG